MKRKLAMLLCVLVAAATLTACQSADEPQVVPISITQAVGPVTTPVQARQDFSAEDFTNDDFQASDYESSSVFDQNPYLDENAEFSLEDILEEEKTNLDDDFSDSDFSGSTYTFDYSVGPTVYPYAGSTPIPLDPVDMPTPTPRPALTFNYMTYNAAALGLTFEGPINWLTDESSYQVYLLTEPNSQMNDNFACEISVSAEPVTETYSQKNLSTYVKQRMSTIYESRLKSYDPSNTAKRYMLGKEGVYMNYTGKLIDGTEVGGRILYVCIEKTLYGLEIMYPLGFKEDYLNVFGQIRTSMKTLN